MKPTLDLDTRNGRSKVDEKCCSCRSRIFRLIIEETCHIVHCRLVTLAPITVWYIVLVLVYLIPGAKSAASQTK